MSLFFLDERYDIIIYSNVFIDWNCFSDERCDRWASCFHYINYLKALKFVKLNYGFPCDVLIFLRR